MIADSNFAQAKTGPEIYQYPVYFSALSGLNEYLFIIQLLFVKKLIVIDYREVLLYHMCEALTLVQR